MFTMTMYGCMIQPGPESGLLYLILMFVCVFPQLYSNSDSRSCSAPKVKCNIALSLLYMYCRNPSGVQGEHLH